MSKRFLKKILRVVLSLFIMVIVLPIARVDADSVGKMIIVDGSTYVLGKSNLPDGLDWDSENGILVLSGFNGKYIHDSYLSNDSKADPFKIKIEGSNNSLENTEGKEALLFDKLEIIGLGKEDNKLSITTHGDNSRTIFSPYGLKITGVDVQIVAKSEYYIKSVMGIHTFYHTVEVNNGNLFIDLEKRKSTEYDVTAIQGNLVLTNNATADFVVNNPEASALTSIVGSNFLNIKGFYSLESKLMAGQGSSDNPYILEAKVALNRDKIIVDDIDKKDSDFKGIVFYNEAKGELSEVSLINPPTTFYVKTYDTSNTDSQVWYKVIVDKGDTFYDVEVTNGNGSGSYRKDEMVYISANNNPENHVFGGWTTDADIVLNNAASPKTTFKMIDEKVKVQATYKETIEIKIDGSIYTLGVSNLPSGLSWNATKKELIMEGYDGGSIHDATSSLNNTLDIRVVGENTIVATNNEEALLFRKLKIKGDNKNNDKLNINVIGNISRAMYNPYGMDIEGVTLEINAELSNTSNPLYGIHTGENMITVDKSNLIVKVKKEVNSEKNIGGVSKSINLINGSSAEFILSNRHGSSDTAPAGSSFLYIKNAYYLGAYYEDSQGNQDNPFLVREVRVAQDKEEIEIKDITIPAKTSGVLYMEGDLTKELDKIELSDSHPTTFFVKLTDSSDLITWHQFTVYRGEKLYNVVVENDGNGTASASLEDAKAGEEIILDAKANDGYVFKAWEIISGDVTITDYKFTMPSNNVVIKATFSKLLDEPTFNYSVLSGDKSIWERGSSQGITVKIDGDFKKFESLEVDGKVLKATSYDVSEGSTIIFLKPAYLQTLKVGNYKMTTKFEGVEVASTFSIKEKEEDKQPEKPDADEKEDEPEEKPKEEKPEEGKPTDKLPGMGDNTKPLALILIALGGLLFTKSKIKE